MKQKTTRLKFAEETADGAKARSPTKPKLMTDGDKAKARAEQLRFGKKDTAQPIDAMKRKQHPHRPQHGLGSAVSDLVRHETSKENEDNNSGVEALQTGESTTEHMANTLENAHYSHKLKQVEKAVKLEKKADKKNIEAIFQKKMDEVTTSNPFSRWQQRRAIRKEYYAAKAAQGSASTVQTAHTAKSLWERLKETGTSIQSALTKGTAIRSVLVVASAFMMIVAPFQSCSLMAGGVLTTVSATSWPAEDIQITRADAYYTKLEAQLQQKINTVEQRHSDCDEYYYNLDEIGHDSTMLISYLSAKYGDFTLNQVKSELEAIFQQQYSYSESIEEETRVTTRTVQAGDYIGPVVTSAYCSCSICCGIWSGGPTASGVYPRANHTIAVDANNPRLPMGTEIIMNGTLYKVEDTGNFARYGVDFDVYYDDHNTALRHGHQTWDAYYAGGNGQTITITEETTVKLCYVTLSSSNLESILRSRMTAEELDMYEVYQLTKGNRVFFGSPLDFDWHRSIVGTYGWTTNGNALTESNALEISAVRGSAVYAVMDGTIRSVVGNTITLGNDKGYQIRYSGCSNIAVRAGEEVTNGQAIADVGSTGRISIEFLYNGTHFNPYFYLDTVETQYSSSGRVTQNAAMLIAKAEQYLGTPYIWGGYSPSGFDCSGFVSYAVNNCGAGLDFGRMTAESWRQTCYPVSAAEVRPGDLVFFQGTYNTSGASHVGIYLGEGMMIAAGSPVKITDITTAYWQQHFYCYGRIPGL